MSNGITIWTDRNGVTREYREVQRKAAVGELIKVVEAECAFDKYHNGDVFEVTDVGEDKYGAQYTQTFIDRQFDKGDPVFLWPNEYVVLEPTDVIHHEGRRYREVKRRAQVGEKVYIRTHNSRSYIGTIRTVKSVNDYGHVVFEGGVTGCYLTMGDEADRYVVLEPIADESQSSEAPDRLAALEERVAALESQLKTCVHYYQDMDRSVTKLESQVSHITSSYDFKLGDTTRKLTESFAALGAFNDKMAQVHEIFGPLWQATQEPEKHTLKPQYSRDAIVGMAKADIDALKETDELKRTAYRHPSSKDAITRYLCNAEFIVNRDKRTVVALLRWRFDNSVRAKGIAKCAPDDCFNVHIGKAIALRRALGIDVPEYYVTAPQPTEAQVGDWCKARNPLHIFKVTDILADGKRCHGYNEEGTYFSNGTLSIMVPIDDSRDGYDYSQSSARSEAA